jgi:hypothetical protein
VICRCVCYQAIDQPPPQIKITDMDDGDEGEYKPEYDWSETDDMSKYGDFAIYDRYLKEYGGIMGGLRSLLR